MASNRYCSFFSLPENTNYKFILFDLSKDDVNQLPEAELVLHFAAKTDAAQSSKFEEEFYSNMKSLYIIHSVNDYRKYSKKTYDMLGLTPGESGKLVDNHICAIENADLTIAINYESSNLMDNMKKQKKLFDTFESNNSMVIDIPKKSNREVWKETANTIELVCKKLK